MRQLPAPAPCVRLATSQITNMLGNSVHGVHETLPQDTTAPIYKKCDKVLE